MRALTAPLRFVPALAGLLFVAAAANAQTATPPPPAASPPAAAPAPVPAGPEAPSEAQPAEPTESAPEAASRDEPSTEVAPGEAIRVESTQTPAVDGPDAGAEASADASSSVVADASAPADSSAGVDDPTKQKGSDVTLKLKGRLVADWEYEEKRPRNGQDGVFAEDTSDFGFSVRQARVGLAAKYKKRLSLELDLEFSNIDDPPAGVRDAWLNYRFARPVQLKVGRFKRPFSRLELYGSGKLPIRSRGIGNDLIVEDQLYGDRSEGLMLWGKLKRAGLNWALSATDHASRGVDFHGRIELEAAEWLEFGLGGVHKISDDGTLTRSFFANDAASADFQIETGGLEIVVDGMLSKAWHRVDSRPTSGALAGLVSHKLTLSDTSELQPVLFGEWADSDLEFSQSEAIRVVAGLNWLWRDRTIRVMPQVEFVRPIDPTATNLWPASDAFYVMFSGQLSGSSK